MFSTDDQRELAAFEDKSVDRPQVCVRTIERTALIRFEGAETLFDESLVQAISEQIHRLIADGHSSLLVNFAGVQYLSGEVLGILATLQRKLEPARGRIHFCGLTPLLRDILRITHLDRVFEVSSDELEAIGLMLHAEVLHGWPQAECGFLRTAGNAQPAKIQHLDS